MKIRILTLAILGLVGFTAVLRADYKESYRKGREAVDKEDWREAEHWMQKAVSESSQEGETIKLYGVRFEPYLPHYYLGLARFHRRDCAGALAQWQESENQRKVQGAEFKTLVRNRDLCRQQLAAAKPPPAPPSAVPAPFVPTPAPPARTEPAASAPQPVVVPEPQKVAEVPAPIPAPRREETPASSVAARPEANQEALGQLPDPSGPPAELRVAARAFLRGDYPAVVRALAAVRYQERKAILTRSLLLAAARYSLFLEVGEKDARLRRQAVDDVRACRRLDPKLTPDAEFFSPRFREFFRKAS